MKERRKAFMLGIVALGLLVLGPAGAQEPSPKHPMPGPMQHRLPESLPEGKARTQQEAGAAANAEKMAPPSVLWIEREYVKTGSREAHRKIVQDILATFRRANWNFQVLGMTAELGEENEEVYLIAFDSFGAIDSFTDQFQSSAAESAELQKLARDERALHASKQSMLAVYRPDLSYRPDVSSVALARMMVMSQSQVRFGEVGSYEDDLKFLISSFEKGNITSHWFTYQVVAGAAPQTFVRIEPMKAFGDWDTFGQQLSSLRSAIGEAGMQRLNELLKGNTVQASGAMETPLVRVYALDPTQSNVSDGFAALAPQFWRP